MVCGVFVYHIICLPPVFNITPKVIKNIFMILMGRTKPREEVTKF